MIGHRDSTTLRSAKGFTIVELMIATIIFATILLIITTGVIQFTRAYYKGAVVAKTQDTARSVMDAVTQSVQFGNATPSPVLAGTVPDSIFFCAGGYRFYSTLGITYNVDSANLNNAGVYLTRSGSTCDSPTGTLDTGGRQLLNNDMRVTQLDLQDAGDKMYTISVTVAYGADDLLCDSANNATCDPGATALTSAQLTSAGEGVRCKIQRGSEFCAVSTLSTVVKKRL